MRGLTLIELLVVSLILAVALALSSSLFSMTTKVFSRETASASVNQGLAGAKHMFIDDVSIAGFPGTSFNNAAVAPTPAIVPVNPTFISGSVTTGTSTDSVAFEGAVNSGATVKRICYQVLAGALQRKVVDQGTACGTTGFDNLITGVTAFTLTFLDSSRTALTAANVTAANNTRYVDLKITVSTASATGNVAKTIYGEAALRNNPLPTPVP